MAEYPVPEDMICQPQGTLQHRPAVPFALQPDSVILHLTVFFKKSRDSAAKPAEKKGSSDIARNTEVTLQS